MHDNSNELLPVVNEKGERVGKALRGTLHNGRDKRLHPVVHLHVFNSQGQVYLQHRPEWKTVQPGKWDTAVGGHMGVDESPVQALLRETAEEIGIVPSHASFLLRYVHESDVERELVYAFKAQTDVDPKPSDELDGGRFFSPEEICRRMGTGFFTPNFELEWERIQPLLHTEIPLTAAL